MRDERNSLDKLDFGVGMVAGLVLRGETTINEQNLAVLHESFLEAFKVVERQLGRENLRFAIILHKGHRTSTDVFNIMSYWLGLWATRDAPGTIYRFRMNEDSARKVLAKLPGGSEMFLAATDAFLVHYRNT
jgi:hypothetical protein